MIDLKLLEELKAYIEETEVNISAEYDCAYNLDELIELNKMPAIYAKVNELINRIKTNLGSDVMAACNGSYVYAVEVPVPDYTHTGVFDHQFLFSSPPTKATLIKVVESMATELDEKYPDYNADAVQIVADLLHSINQVPDVDWVMLKDHQLSENTHVDVKLGNFVTEHAPFCWNKIYVSSGD